MTRRRLNCCLADISSTPIAASWHEPRDRVRVREAVGRAIEMPRDQRLLGRAAPLVRSDHRILRPRDPYGAVAARRCCWRGKGIAALAGVRTAEAIVRAIGSDDRHPGIVRREATDVAASRCRQGDREFRWGENTNAIASEKPTLALGRARAHASGTAALLSGIEQRSGLSLRPTLSVARKRRGGGESRRCAASVARHRPELRRPVGRDDVAERHRSWRALIDLGC